MTVTLIPRDRKPEEEDHYIEAQAVNSKAAREMYKKRTQIYPKLVQGRFRQLKWAAMAVLLAIYYITPWIRWDRGADMPNQAALVDFEGRRFYFFMLELWPQEVYFITGLLILAAVGIFLSSALFGRVWCGYACPQTVWTDLFIHVERFFEGDRAERMRLAKAPWTISKLSKKVGKHAVWLLIAAATGGAWLFYFGDAPTLFREIFTGHANPVIYLFIGALTFTTYALAGTMREQVCTYMCPWPRIQAAMTDKDALSVTYRVDRGEPRGPHKKGEPWEGRGDCVDCKQCVAVCPQGIDIRDGDQMECINCALCIDACDAVMDRVGRPRGLIAYDAYENQARRAAGQTPRWNPVRLRTVLYAVIMIGVGIVMLYGLTHRQMLQLDAMRDRSPAFVRLATGEVRNGYTVRIINKENRARNVVITVEGLPGARLAASNHPSDAAGAIRVPARRDDVTTLRLHITAPAAQPTASTRFRFVLRDEQTGQSAIRESVFVTGGAR